MKVKAKKDIATKVIEDVNSLKSLTIQQSAKKISSYFKTIAQGQQEDEQLLTDGDQEDISIDDLINSDQQQFVDDQMEDEIESQDNVTPQFDDLDGDGDVDTQVASQLQVDNQGFEDDEYDTPLPDDQVESYDDEQEDSQDIEFTDQERKLAQSYDDEQEDIAQGEEDIEIQDDQEDQDDLIIEIEDDTEQCEGCQEQTLSREQIRRVEQSYKRKLHIANKKIKALQQSNTKLKEQKSKLDKTMKVLNYKIQEIKLFNKKMQYVNQIFNKYSLSKIQKQSVLDMFDKAQDSKQAKLVYESFVKSMKPQQKRNNRTQSISSKPTRVIPNRLTQGVQRPTQKPIENDADVDIQVRNRFKKRIGLV